MSTQLLIPFTAAKVRVKRETKQSRIEQHFWESIGKEFSSYAMHGKFGSAFRSRVSDINRDPESRVVIKNRVVPQADGEEHSVYWSERRGVTPYLKQYMEEEG